MPLSFSILYFFENPALIIAEIRSLRPAGDAEHSDGNHWVYFEKTTGTLLKLLYSSEDSSGAVEERYFDQGYLKFTHIQATFIEKFNFAQHTLENKTKKNIDGTFISLLENYCSSL
jgi:hypothetical protein